MLTVPRNEVRIEVWKMANKIKFAIFIYVLSKQNLVLYLQASFRGVA